MGTLNHGFSRTMRDNSAEKERKSHGTISERETRGREGREKPFFFSHSLFYEDPTRLRARFARDLLILSTDLSSVSQILPYKMSRISSIPR